MKTKSTASSGIDIPFTWEYRVLRVGNELHLSWTAAPRLRKLRLHTSPNYYPYHEATYSSIDLIVVKPNQWCEMQIDNVWAYMTDVDNTKLRSGATRFAENETIDETQTIAWRITSEVVSGTD